MVRIRDVLYSSKPSKQGKAYIETATASTIGGSAHGRDTSSSFELFRCIIVGIVICSKRYGTFFGPFETVPEAADAQLWLNMHDFVLHAQATLGRRYFRADVECPALIFTLHLSQVSMTALIASCSTLVSLLLCSVCVQQQPNHNCTLEQLVSRCRQPVKDAKWSGNRMKFS